MVALNWVVFGVLILVITLSVVWLARVTARAMGWEHGTNGTTGSEHALDQLVGGSRWFLYGNVVVSHGIFGVLIVVVVWLSGIPTEAFSVGMTHRYFIGIGIGVGVGLFVLSEGVKYGLPDDQLVYSEHLRELLAPATLFEWVGLVGIILPVVAVVEELLFRGALVGAFAYGFGVSPWLLAVGSSVVFGIGHGIQGRSGIVATGMLGFLLAVVFIVTKSLVVVIVAHYFVNLLEFVVHEYISTLFSRSNRD